MNDIKHRGIRWFGYSSYLERPYGPWVGYESILNYGKNSKSGRTIGTTHYTLTN